MSDLDQSSSTEILASHLLILVETVKDLTSSLNTQKEEVVRNKKATKTAADHLTDAGEAANQSSRNVERAGLVDIESSKGNARVREKSILRTLGVFGKLNSTITDTYTQGLGKTLGLTDKGLNFFEEARRKEAIGRVKSFTSVTHYLKLFIGFLSGALMQGAKDVVKSFSQISSVSAAFGKSFDDVLNTKFLAELAKSGITYKEGVEAIVAATTNGFNPMSKGMQDLAKRSALLGMDVSQNTAITKQLSVTTGIGNKAGLELVNATLDLAQSFHLDSHRLVMALQELGPTLARVSLAQGKDAAIAMGETLTRLTSLMGSRSEGQIADLLQGLAGNQFKTFVTKGMFAGNVSSEALAGKEGSKQQVQALADLGQAIKSQLTTASGGSSAEVGALLAPIFADLTGLTQNQLESLMLIADSFTTSANNEIENRNVLLKQQEQTILTNDLMRSFNTSLQALLVSFTGEAIPVVRFLSAYLQVYGSIVSQQIIKVAKFSYSLVAFAVRNFGLLLGMKGLLFLSNTLSKVHALQAQVLEAKNVGITHNILRGIHTELVRNTATTAAGNATATGGKFAGALSFLGPLGMVAGLATTAFTMYSAYKGAKGVLNHDYESPSEDAQIKKLLKQQEDDMANELAELRKQTKSLDTIKDNSSKNNPLNSVFENAQVLQSELSLQILEELKAANALRQQDLRQRIIDGSTPTNATLNAGF